METVIPVPSRPEYPLPDWATGTDPRSSPETVERLLSRYSEPGDVVLDPFAGFGTTPVAAEATGREAWSVEYEPDRVAHVRDRVDHPDRVLAGDARDLDALALPAVDCCLTSPPYATEGATSTRSATTPARGTTRGTSRPPGASTSTWPPNSSTGGRTARGTATTTGTRSCSGTVPTPTTTTAAGTTATGATPKPPAPGKGV